MCRNDPTVQWLSGGDAAIRWQALRDLAKASRRVVEREQQKVANTGWGARLLKLQDSDGQWGGGIYTPKWTSTTYTMVLLRQLGLPPRHPRALQACALLFNRGFYRDGGFNCWRNCDYSETCVTGMLLAVAAYFQFADDRVHRFAEFLLKQQMGDGGWNCQAQRGATHSSFHTTISVLEGLLEYERFNPRHAVKIRRAQARGREFLLRHRLFRSHRTGRIVNSAMTRFSFPPRWHYDILRGLGYFRQANAPRDPRLSEAIDIVRQRRMADGRWVLQNCYPGRVFFEMEKLGQASRWNTLRALRVLRWWEGK